MKYLDLGFGTSLSEIDRRPDNVFNKTNELEGKNNQPAPEGKHVVMIEYALIWPLLPIFAILLFRYFFLHNTSYKITDNLFISDGILKYSFNNISKSSEIFPPAVLAFIALIGMAMILGILSFTLHFLRRISNPLYWQLACWFLIALGILLRPFVVLGADPLQTSIKGALVSGILALAVFPGIMRLLNRLKPEPGLIHVSLPFALGFFLDVAQTLAKTYIPIFTWLR